MIAHRYPILMLALMVGAAACDDDDDPVQPQTLVCGATLADADGAGTDVETDATGEALFTIVGTEMDWEVASTGLADVTAAHIHRASGAPFIPATGIFPLSATGDGEGTMTLTQAQVNEIDDAGVYFNIHTETYAGGEISGTLVCD
jgi:hypothetical protein